MPDVEQTAAAPNKKLTKEEKKKLGVYCQTKIRSMLTQHRQLTPSNTD